VTDVKSILVLAQTGLLAAFELKKQVKGRRPHFQAMVTLLLANIHSPRYVHSDLPSVSVWCHSSATLLGVIGVVAKLCACFASHMLAGSSPGLFSRTSGMTTHTIGWMIMC
jgi:hypothetical protein